VRKTTIKKQLSSIGILLLFGGTSSILFITPVQADQGWIHVSTPSGGTWYVGDFLNISWTSGNAGNYVDILFYIGEMQRFTVASNFYNSGSNENYQWLIPSGIPTGLSCRIKIVSTSNQSIYGFSDYFTLYDRYISVHTPATGEAWSCGEIHGISWESFNFFGNVQLSLYQSDTYVMRIAQNIPYSSGTYMWNIPTTINPGTSYKIRIDAIGYPGIFSYSGYFSIKKRSIQVTSPTKDTTWYLGGIYQITWVSDQAGPSVDISLYEKKEYEMSFRYSQSIITGADNDGVQTWTIPSSLTPSSLYRIYIISVVYGDVFNFSGSFHIEARYISVTSPESNDTWYIGETYNITWNSENAGDSVNIELYQNGMQKAVLIENTSNNGVFMWSIPLDTTPDGSSQIKIRSSNMTSLYGISGLFSLSKKSVEVTSPQNTDLWYKGERHVIVWETKGFSSNVRIDLCVDAAVAVTIAGSVENSGRYDWTVPLDVSSGSLYIIKITSVTDESIYGFSPGHLIIESTFLQQWSGTIILFGAVSGGFIIAFFVIIRNWRRRITAEEDQASEMNQIVPEQLSEDEYEKIWEQNRD
jgi:hypothetical protein